MFHSDLNLIYIGAIDVKLLVLVISLSLYSVMQNVGVHVSHFYLVQICFFYIWLMSHILRTSTEHKTASLVDEGNSVYVSLVAHTTLNTYKPMEINIERSPQH